MLHFRKYNKKRNEESFQTENYDIADIPNQKSHHSYTKTISKGISIFFQDRFFGIILNYDI